MPEEAEIKENLNGRFDTLPAELKTAVAVVHLPTIIYETGKKHELALDKIGILGDIVREFIVGSVGAREFVTEIRQRLNLPEEKSKAIAREINSAAFRPIRDALRKATTEPQPPPLPKPAAPPPTKPIIPPAAPPPPKKPEPLIIRPMPSPPAAPPAVKPKIAPPVFPTVPAAPKTATPIPAAGPKPAPAVKPVEPASAKAPAGKPEKQAQIITPLGARPAAPQAIYEKAKEEVKKELETFRKDEVINVITKEELQKEIERFRPAPKSPAPLKLPQEKIPQPPAPESYGVDPYREQTE